MSYCSPGQFILFRWDINLRKINKKAFHNIHWNMVKLWLLKAFRTNTMNSISFIPLPIVVWNIYVYTRIHIDINYMCETFNWVGTEPRPLYTGNISSCCELLYLIVVNKRENNWVLNLLVCAIVIYQHFLNNLQPSSTLRHVDFHWLSRTLSSTDFCFSELTFVQGTDRVCKWW